MQAVARTLEHKSDENLFERIYQAAKAKKKEMITALLSQVCVDVKHPVKGTPASKLAAEGDTEAVEFLRIEFKASLGYIAEGYASSGNVNEAKKIFGLASNVVEQHDILQRMISGYAQIKHDEAKKILASHSTYRLDLLKSMICGYAKGKHVSEAKKVLVLASNTTERMSLLGNMLWGLCLSGEMTETEKFTSNFADPAEQRALLEYLTSALDGDVAEAKKLLSLVLNPKIQFALLQNRICGHAFFGNFDEMNKTLVLVSNLMNLFEWWSVGRSCVLKGLAINFTSAGHDEIEKILAVALNPSEQLYLMKSMICGFAKGGYVAKAEKLLNKVLASNAALRSLCLKYMATGFAQDGHVVKAQEVFALALEHSLPSEQLGTMLDITSHYILGGNIDEALKTLDLANPAERIRLIKNIVNLLKERSIFSNNESPLLTLALFKPDDQKKVVEELKDSKIKMDEDATKLLQKATQLHPLITNKSSIFVSPTNFRFKLGTASNVTHEWLLRTGIQFVNKGKLNDDTLLAIAEFLAPISQAESLDLCNRLFTVCRSKLFYSKFFQDYRMLAADPNKFYSNLLKNNRLLAIEASVDPVNNNNKHACVKNGGSR